MDASTKSSKETGSCSVCWEIFKIQKRDGTLHKHGHADLKINAVQDRTCKPPAISYSAVHEATKADVGNISSTAARWTPSNNGNLQTRSIVTLSLPSTSSKANLQPDDLSL